MPKTSRSWLAEKMKSGWLDKFSSLAISFALAVLAWLYGSSRDQEILEHIQLPVDVALPASELGNYSLETLGPAKVGVSFSGSPIKVREFRDSLQRNEIIAHVIYRVPVERVNEPKYGDTIIVSEDDIPVPPGLRARLADGKNRIQLNVSKLIEKSLPVKLESGLEGVLPIQANVDPPTVLVKGPQEIIEKARFISTIPANIALTKLNSAENQAAGVKVPLVEEIDGKPIRTSPGKVTVKLIPEPQKIYELSDIPIRFLIPPDFGWRPKFLDDRSAKLDVRIKGPVLTELPKVTAYIDLTAKTGVAGLNVETIKLVLPKDFFQLEEIPKERTIELTPVEPVKKSLGTINGPP